MYIERHASRLIIKGISQSKVILVTGARQVGKTTVLQNTLDDWQYWTMDDENQLRLAQADPVVFFKDKTFPYIIDEIQYVPDIFRTLKYHIDRQPGKGLVALTDSSSYELMNSSSQSLAGRISIIEMSGLSLRELAGDAEVMPFLPDSEFLERRRALRVKPLPDLWKRIVRGSMPELQDPSRDLEWFYRDYIRTYIERDVRKLMNVKDELKFRKFLASVAARSARMISYNEIADDAGIDVKAVHGWLSILEGSGMVRMLQPYGGNILKRALKTPKLFFMDTGLLCYLCGWKTPQTAEFGAQNGAIFETFAVSEIIKSHLNAKGDANGIYYYGDKDKNEVDVVIEDGVDVYLVEMKKSGTIKGDWTKGFSRFPAVDGKTVRGCAVVCRCDSIMRIDESAYAVPIEAV